MLPLMIIGGIIFAVIVILVIFKKQIFGGNIDSIKQMIKAKRYSEAEAALKKLIDINNENALAHFLLGELYYKQENYEWAMPEYKIVVKLNAFGGGVNQGVVRERLASIYLHFGQLEEAQKEFLLLAQLEPNNPRVYYNIGKIFEEREYPDKALNYAKKALEINSEDPDALYLSGKINYQMKRPSDALSDLTKAVKIEPTNYKAHYFLGMVYFYSKNFAKALIEFDFGSRHPEFKQKALLQKGLSYFELGDFDNARIELERSVKQIKGNEPAGLLARYKLAIIYESKKDITSAIEQWEAISSVKKNYQDVEEKLAAYNELRMDDMLKDFYIASNPDFVDTCKSILENYMKLSIVEVAQNTGVYCEIIALESDKEFFGGRSVKKVARFYRVSEPLGEPPVREILETVKEIKANSAIIVTASNFTNQAKVFAQTRPIELLEKEDLSKILREI